MVAAAVTQMHLDRTSAERQSEQLVPEADAEDRQPGAEQFADNGDGEGTGRQRIARAVGKKYPVGPQCQDRRRRSARRDHSDAAAETGKTAQDVAFGAVIDADHVAVREATPAVAALD